MAFYSYKKVMTRSDYQAAIEPAMSSLGMTMDDYDGDANFDDVAWDVTAYLLEQKDSEIERLRALLSAPQPQPALVGELVEALEDVYGCLSELVEVAELRGDADLPHPADDAKLWTARMQSAWDHARELAEGMDAALAKARAATHLDPAAGDLFRDADGDGDGPAVSDAHNVDTGGPGRTVRIARWRELPDSFAGTNAAGETRVFSTQDEAEAFAATGKES